MPDTPAGPDKLAFRPVDGDTIGDFEAFFGCRGAPHYCWCMVWRRTSQEAKHNDGPSRKRQMMARLETGVPIGLLAYEGEAPVAWVSVAPRETYRNLGGPVAEAGERIWSIVCFFVPRKRRGAGTIKKLIAAAVDHAKGEGATVVEAYPVDEDAPSYGFMGRVHTFADAGFVDCGMAGKRRHVMRLEVGR